MRGDRSEMTRWLGDLDTTARPSIVQRKGDARVRHGMDGDPRHAWYEMGVSLGRKARMQRGDRHPRAVRR